MDSIEHNWIGYDFDWHGEPPEIFDGSYPYMPKPRKFWGIIAPSTVHSCSCGYDGPMVVHNVGDTYNCEVCNSRELVFKPYVREWMKLYGKQS